MNTNLLTVVVLAGLITGASLELLAQAFGMSLDALVSRWAGKAWRFLRF